MPPLRVLLDECVDRRLSSVLIGRGFPTVTAGSEGIAGSTDETLLGYTAIHDLVLLTHNRNDFQHLHAMFSQQGRQHGGIVIVPQTPLPLLALRAAMTLDWLATFFDYRSQLIRWGDLQIKLTQGFRLAGYSEAEIRQALGRG